MSNIDKPALREAADAANKSSWGRWESYHPHKGARGYEVKVGVRAVAQHCLKVDAAFIAAANPAVVLALLDELEAAEHTAAVDHEAACSLVEENEELKRRIAELEAREVKLPPTFWYEHDDLPREIPVLSRRLVINALREAGIKIAAGIGKGE